MKIYIKSAISNLDDEPLSVRFELAEDFSLDKDALKRLSESDPNIQVRQTAESTLGHISDVEEFKHLDAPHLISGLSVYAKSRDPRIRWQVAQHPDIPLESLQELTRDEDPRVRKVALSALERRGA